MAREIRPQKIGYSAFYITFALLSLVIMVYYLSNTIAHFTTGQQFPINSFHRFPLTYIIFPAEVFSFIFTLYFVYNLVRGNQKTTPPKPLDNKNKTSVAILIPVYNEPPEIVARTLDASNKIRWGGTSKVYLLDDSNTDAHKKSISQLAKKYNATLITRKDRIGFKAGNINNAIKNHISEEYFVILDCDQAPEPEFLQETMDYFSDPNIAFVQTPQYFINNDTLIERAQTLGTNIFYQTQCVSKAKDKAMPFCGTNVVIRKEAFVKVNGFSYYTSTEDIELGLRMNEAGYYGAYVPKVLVKGYATTDFSAYASQQYRWANGNLAILRESWPQIMFGKFTLKQQIHTIFTTGWWLVGIVSFLYVLMPILSFFFGGTHHSWLPTWMLGLLFANVAMGIMMIYVALKNRSEEKVTFADAFLQYSLITNSMFIYMKAALSALIGKYVGFVRTNKSMQKTGLGHIKWNLIFAAACFGFSMFALYNAAISSSIEQIRASLPVSLWLLFYSLILGSSILFVGDVSESASPALNTHSSPVVSNSKSSTNNAMRRTA